MFELISRFNPVNGRAVSSNPTAKVCTGRSIICAISATIRLESSPPLSIAPSGTSLISRIRTDSSSFASSRSLHSSTLPPRSSVGCG